MARLRVHNLAMSLDGFVAGPDQRMEAPLGVGGPSLHEWVFATRTGRQMLGLDGGDEGLDDVYLQQGVTGIGATIMGRNMFGPVRGPWEEAEAWQGWWGDDPPYHHPVFVLTHYPRAPITMQGGTTFHFVSEGIEAALDLAVSAAGGLDVRLGGGATAVREYLSAGLVDELHLAVVPILLGAGERPFDQSGTSSVAASGTAPAGFRCVELASSAAVAHVRLVRET